MAAGGVEIPTKPDTHCNQNAFQRFHGISPAPAGLWTILRFEMSSRRLRMAVLSRLFIGLLVLFVGIEPATHSHSLTRSADGSGSPNVCAACAATTQQITAPPTLPPSPV